MNDKFKSDTGPLLNIDELDDHEVARIATEVFKRIGDNRDDDMHEHYLAVLIENGLMCPHPQHKRLYGGEKSTIPLTTPAWYDCEMCRCSVFNERYYEDEEAPATKKIF